MPQLRTYSPTKLCHGIHMANFWPVLRPVFSASHAQHISDLHPKFALRPHHVWKYAMVDIQSATAENRRWIKKIERKRNHRAKIWCPHLLRRAAIITKHRVVELAHNNVSIAFTRCRHSPESEWLEHIDWQSECMCSRILLSSRAAPSIWKWGYGTPLFGHWGFTWKIN